MRNIFHAEGVHGLGAARIDAAVTGGTRDWSVDRRDPGGRRLRRFHLRAPKPDEVGVTMQVLKTQDGKAFRQALDVTNTAKLNAWIYASAEALGGLDIVDVGLSVYRLR